ncbi:hypothetical protein [Haladaptatus salinisoli]|uniref:hypothetical protein n=1 Tax=Haladaptatus salinisoli TaxID=2884876 RepID=UPI0034A1EC70
MPILTDYGLIKKIGPKKNSGLYELTEKGRIALESQNQYDPDDTQAFDDLLEQKLAERDE